MSARNLGSLTVDLILRTIGLTQGADKAERELSRRTRAMQESARRAGVAIGSALAIGVGTAATAIIAATKSAIDFADSIRDMSIRTGLSTETLSGFAYAAKQTGTDIEALGKSFNILSKNATAALNPKSRQAGLFKALIGDDYAKDLNDLEKLIPRVADAFADLEEGPIKAGLALQLLGRQGAEAIEFYSSGADGLKEFADRARELGIELSQETTDAADEFKDKIEDLKTALLGVGVQVAEDLLPKLIDLVDIVSEFAREGGNAEGVADAIAGSFEFAARTGVGLYEVFRQIKLRMNDIVLAAGEMSPGAGIRSLFEGGDYMKPYEDLRKQRLEIAGQLEESNKRLVGAVNGGTGKEEKQTFTLPGISVQGTKKQIDEAEKQAKRLAGFLNNPTGRKPSGGSKKSGKSDAEREAEQLEKALRRMADAEREWNVELNDNGNPIAKEYADRLADLTAQTERFKEDGIPTAEIEAFTERMKSLASSIQSKELAEFQEEFAQDTLDLAAAMEGPGAAGMVAYQREVGELNKELKSGLITLDQYNERMDAMTTPFEEVSKAIQDEIMFLGMSAEQQEIYNNLKAAGVDANSEFGRSIVESTKALQEAREQTEFMNETQSSLADSFADFITGAKSAKEAFGDFADELFKRAAQFVADQAIKKLFESFSGTSTSSSGSGGFDWAALFGSFFGGGKASGGTAIPQMMYQVNERGFEMATVGGRDYMLTGSQPVQITPNNKIGGGLSQTNNIVIQGIATRQTVERASQLTGREAQRALARTGR